MHSHSYAYMFISTLTLIPTLTLTLILTPPLPSPSLSPSPLSSPLLSFPLTVLAVRPGLKFFGTPVQSYRLQRTRQPSLLSLYLKPFPLRYYTSNASIRSCHSLDLLCFVSFCFFPCFESRLVLPCPASHLDCLLLLSLIIGIPLHLIRH